MPVVETSMSRSRPGLQTRTMAGNTGWGTCAQDCMSSEYDEPARAAFLVAWDRSQHARCGARQNAQVGAACCRRRRAGVPGISDGEFRRLRDSDGAKLWSTEHRPAWWRTDQLWVEPNSTSRRWPVCSRLLHRQPSRWSQARWHSALRRPSRRRHARQSAAAVGSACDSQGEVLPRDMRNGHEQAMETRVSGPERSRDQ